MGKLLINDPSPVVVVVVGRMKEASQQRKKKTGQEIGFLRTVLSGKVAMLIWASNFVLQKLSLRVLCHTQMKKWLCFSL